MPTYDFLFQCNGLKLTDPSWTCSGQYRTETDVTIIYITFTFPNGIYYVQCEKWLIGDQTTDQLAMDAKVQEWLDEITI